MKAMLLALALVAALAVAATSFAGGTGGVIGKSVAVGKMQATTIEAGSGAMILEKYTILPGGNFGWHIHPAPVAVVVTGGTLTVFDPKVANCEPFKVSKGQSFVEPANHVHLARNDGRKPVTLYALYLGVPKVSDANHGESRPAGCNA